MAGVRGRPLGSEAGAGEDHKCTGRAEEAGSSGTGVGRGFLEEGSLPLVYAAYGATSRGSTARGFWGPSLVSTCTRNRKAPAPDSASMLESVPPIENLFVV